MYFLRNIIWAAFLFLVVQRPGFLLANEIHCICQFGTTPIYQIPFFKLGCLKWLHEQNRCDSIKIIELPDFKNSFHEINLPYSAKDGLLKLGYVGHWANTQDSALYILKVILPTIEKNNVNVLIDNTACKGAEVPQLIVNSAKLTPIIFPQNHWIKYKANQVISVGMWSSFGLPSSINFGAIVTLPDGVIDYPSCTDFDGKFCLNSIQKNQKANCLNNSNQIQELQCCPNKLNDFDSIIHSNQNWLWQHSESENCLNEKNN